MATIRERVIDIIAEQLVDDTTELTDQTSFVNDLGADSLDLVELVMELEDEFDIHIPDEQAELVLTVGQAVALVTKLAGENY